MSIKKVTAMINVLPLAPVSQALNRHGGSGQGLVTFTPVDALYGINLQALITAKAFSFIEVHDE